METYSAKVTLFPKWAKVPLFGSQEETRTPDAVEMRVVSLRGCRMFTSSTIQGGPSPTRNCYLRALRVAPPKIEGCLLQILHCSRIRLQGFGSPRRVDHVVLVVLRAELRILKASIFRFQESP